VRARQNEMTIKWLRSLDSESGKQVITGGRE
jgi:hypothetical protein